MSHPRHSQWTLSDKAGGIMRDIFTLFHHARHKNKLQQEGRFIFIYKECVIHTHTQIHVWTVCMALLGLLNCCWTLNTSTCRNKGAALLCYMLSHPTKRQFVGVCLRVSKNTWGSEGLAVVQAEPTETPHLYWYVSFDTSLLIGRTFYPCVSLLHCLQSQYRACLSDWTSEGH